METEEQFDFITPVIANGRVTIPARIRKILGISDGDVVKVKIVRIVKKTSERVLPRKGEERPGMTGQEEKEVVVEDA